MGAAENKWDSSSYEEKTGPKIQSGIWSEVAQ